VDCQRPRIRDAFSPTSEGVDFVDLGCQTRPYNPERGIFIVDQQLGDVEVRVLGSLIEKEITTPDYYTLSLNALVAA
jgi:hypothetical protein